MGVDVWMQVWVWMYGYRHAFVDGMCVCVCVGMGVDACMEVRVCMRVWINGCGWYVCMKVWGVDACM